MIAARARQLAEVGAPGAAIGVLAATVVGGMAALVGQPAAWALAGVAALGVPLAALGAGYGVLVAAGWFKPGVFAPVAVYWMVGFPLSRLLHETVTPALLGGSPTPPGDVPTFLLFQLLISMGFAIGFLWLHERITPAWLARIRGHNPAAAQVYARYLDHAEAIWRARERKRVQLTAGRARSGSADGARSRRSS